MLAALVAMPANTAAQDCAGPEPGPPTLLKTAQVIFAGTMVGTDDAGKNRFRITEAFRGVKGQYIDVYEFPGGGIHFQAGKQYLVIADECLWHGHEPGCIGLPPCSRSRPIEYAEAVIQQLRAERSGRKVASVYGTLWRRLEPYIAISDNDYSRPLANVPIKLQGTKRSFETRTDEHGAYAFEGLPADKYTVSAELPPNLALAQIILAGPVPPFDLPPRSSFEYDIYAMPTGRVSGKVIGPDGQPLRSTSVELYRLSRLKQGGEGLYGFQGAARPSEKWKPFEFDHLPPDDYVLVFNSRDQEQPDAPFRRTFYPRADSLESAQIIHLGDGEQIVNADIYVSNPLPTRRISLRIDWGARTAANFYPPYVIVKASRGTAPHPFEESQGVYTLNLLQDARYDIHGEALCRTGGGKAETGVATVDGSDLSVSQVTLTVDRGTCERK